MTDKYANGCLVRCLTEKSQSKKNIYCAKELELLSEILICCIFLLLHFTMNDMRVSAL